jgi:hypothetical protein
MSRNSTSPRGIEPKRPTLRPRPASSLPPVPSPPRRTLAPGEVPPTLRRATLPPMPVVPQLAARPLDDDDLSLTEVRPSDDDASVPGVTEVKSVLRFNRRGRIPAADLFEAQTNRLERNELFARAGLSPSEEIETSPTLTRPEPLPQARSTIQVSPAALEQVRRLSATLERDRVPVLELVDSVDYRADELGDDDLVDDEEPETVSELDMPPARAHEVSHPELQAFRGNEDWGVLAGHEVPAPIETGETAFLGPARTLVRFDDEDEPVPPVDVAFEDDGSLVADLRPESLEVRAVHAPHAPHSPHAGYEAALAPRGGRGRHGEWVRAREPAHQAEGGQRSVVSSPPPWAHRWATRPTQCPTPITRRPPTLPRVTPRIRLRPPTPKRLTSTPRPRRTPSRARWASLPTSAPRKKRVGSRESCSLRLFSWRRSSGATMYSGRVRLPAPRSRRLRSRARPPSSPRRLRS